MMNLVRLFSALAVVAVATGCGTGFIDGWRDESEAPKKQPSLDLTDVTNEEQCKQVPDAGWFDDKCIAYADADEAQCASIADWAWLDGKCRTAAEVACIASGRAYVNGQCLDRPTLSADGDLSQSIVAGFAIEPIALTITPGAFAKLSDETCPGFFKINGGKVESGDGMALAGDVTSCRATVTANNQFAASDSLTISVKLEDGFYSLCKRGDQNKTVRAIRYALVGDDGDLSCSAIGATLVKTSALALNARGIVDLTPLRGLKALKTLVLFENGITDISILGSLKSLTYLDIEANRVTDLRPLAELTSLTELYADSGMTHCPKDAASPAVAHFCDAGNAADRQ